MPKDLRIKKTLIIGSGPIVIGQAAEFDYSGTQAVQALEEEGVEVVLINSNPATIMTDADLASRTYIEPINAEFVRKIIEKERPDSIIAGMGGQTGLNMACELFDDGTIRDYGLKVIGTPIEAIKQGEDRELFKELMKSAGQPVIASGIVTTVDEGLGLAEQIGYPVVVRPAYTLGGTGGGIAADKNELAEILENGLHMSRVGQAIIEKSIKGWREIEFEAIRDCKGNCVIVCSMENVDPVGVHTGDSIVVAPAQTLSRKEYDMLAGASLKIVEAVGIQGGCNVQFALSPDSFEYFVIEINPRVSRSSALASKAAGYPIAKVAAKIALGYTLDEIKNGVTGAVACFWPAVDYVVLKIPKWPFDKFTGAKRNLGTRMMATGEVMSIGVSFEQALLKAVRSLEIGQYSLERKSSRERSLDELKRRVQIPDDERLFDLAEMLRREYRVDMVSHITGIEPFFIEKIKNIVEAEERLKKLSLLELDGDTLLEFKKLGFSDKGIADFIGVSPMDIYNVRRNRGIRPSYKSVDSCAGEFDAVSPYYYSTYDNTCEANTSGKKKVVVIGSGPIRIGQGIEFDYCSVHAVKALKQAGITTIIINNNPETVSTDFDTADRLYFEPLTEEDVQNVIELENPDGVILQFGGQTSIKLAAFLKLMNVPILGTDPDNIDAAEDREKFDALMEEYQIPRPSGTGVMSLESGLKAAEKLGYPVLVRPSYVLGGKGMEITYSDDQLSKYLVKAFLNDKKYPVLIDRYLEGRELEVDAVCDGWDVLIPGVMEHLERAGVHSGDSISVYPTQNVSQRIKDQILEVSKRIAKALKVIGMVNIQFIEFKDELYVIEVNPRSSRTVPYISKVSGVPVAGLATQVMLGKKLKDMGYTTGIAPEMKLVAVKVPVFSTEKLPMVEIGLGPEMRSTGEVLGVGQNLQEALFKGFTAAGVAIPRKGSTVIATIRDRDKDAFIDLAKRFEAKGCKFLATEGTAKSLIANGVDAYGIKKVGDGVPNIIDIIRSGLVDLVIDIPSLGDPTPRNDGFKIRRAAAETGVSIVTSLDTASALLLVLESGVTGEAVDVYTIDLS